METTPIGLIIRQIVKEKKMSAVDIAGKLGVSRQAVYQTFTREKMNQEERKMWSEALGVDIDEFEKKDVNQKSSNNGDYLMKYIQELETRLLKQDQTISHLLHVNEVLLGKSNSVYVAGFVPYIFLTFIYKSMYTLYP